MTSRTKNKYEHLTRLEYSVQEIAYMMGLTVRTVRSYLKKKSLNRPDEMLLPSTRDAVSGMYVISRDNLITFFKERYGE